MSSDKKGNAGALYEAVSLGLVFPIAIGVGFAIGRGLDRLFGIYPWMTIVFTVFGIAAAFVNLFRAGATSDDKSGPGEG